MKMTTSAKAPRLNEEKLRDYPGLNRFIMHFKRDWQLHLLILLPVAYMLIFHYIPMYGVQIAFRSYSAKAGIVDSQWVGLKWFIRFMDSSEFMQILWNTISLSLYTIAVSFPLPVLFALMLNAMRKEKFKKVVQSVAYMPHFISTVVIVNLMNLVFSPISGIYGNLSACSAVKASPRICVVCPRPSPTCMCGPAFGRPWAGAPSSTPPLWPVFPRSSTRPL
jgi:ABC-type sugar transport system permease subunit